MTKYAYKTLTQTDRRSIASQLKSAAAAKWDATPEALRMRKLEEAMSKLVQVEQEKELTLDRRAVLEHFDLIKMKDNHILVEQETQWDKEEYQAFVGYSWSSSHRNRLVLTCYYVDVSSSVDALVRGSASGVIAYLNREHKELLQEWWDLNQTRDCELSQLYSAWMVVLKQYKSNNVLFKDYPELIDVSPDKLTQPVTKNSKGETVYVPEEIAKAKKKISEFGNGTNCPDK